jgi:hypothetical protein
MCYCAPVPSSTAPEIQQTAYTRVDKTEGSDGLLP